MILLLAPVINGRGAEAFQLAFGQSCQGSCVATAM